MCYLSTDHPSKCAGFPAPSNSAHDRSPGSADGAEGAGHSPADVGWARARPFPPLCPSPCSTQPLCWAASSQRARTGPSQPRGAQRHPFTTSEEHDAKHKNSSQNHNAVSDFGFTVPLAYYNRKEQPSYVTLMNVGQKIPNASNTCASSVRTQYPDAL